MKHIIFSFAKDLYRRIPLRARIAFERLISPATKRLYFAGLSWKLPHLATRRPVSIVIPSYNDVHLLRPLLRSIESTVQNREYEVIISDDYCQQENTKVLKSLESRTVRVVTTEERTGFAGAVNRGLAQARWDVALLNSDILALPGWLDWLQYCAYEVDPLVGMVSPHLIYPTGRIQYGGTYQNRVAAPQWFSHLFQGKPANYRPAQDRRYIRANCGAAMYVTQKTLSAIGPLDEHYWLGFEDVDWSFRAWKAGIRCMIEPASRLIHLESATRGFSQGPREYGSMRRFWNTWKASTTLSPQETRVVLVHSQPGNFALTELSETMAANLENHLGIQVSLCTIPDNVVIDETLVSRYSSPQFRLIALDKGSLASVWLACVGQSTPLAYFDDFDSAKINPSSATDLALLPPEFDFAVSNKANLASLSASLPWGISLVGPPVSAPIAELQIKPLSELLVVAASESLMGELRNALQNRFTIMGLTKDELLRKLSNGEAGGMIGKVVLFGGQLSSSSIALKAMSQGAIIFHQNSPQVAFDLLDGYNSFNYDPSDLPRLVAQINDLTENETATLELISNGISTSMSAMRAFAQQMESLLNLTVLGHLPEVS